jgi:hypothetical protein
MTAASWTGQPALVVLLAKLHELTARVARVEALKQVQRSAAVAQAFQSEAASDDSVRSTTPLGAERALGGRT